MVEKLSAQSKYSHGASREDRGFTACKISPTDQTLSIVALASLRKPVVQVDSEALYDLDVMLVANENDKIFKRTFQKSAFKSDAVALDEISIDTARYNLSPQVRAFGIRAKFASNSHSYSYRVETVNLYLPEGKALKKVLADLILVEDIGSGDFDFVGPDDTCTGTATQTKRTLSLGRAVDNGYADIVIAEKKTLSDSKLVNSKCKTTTVQSTKSHTLHFDGNFYIVPKELQYK